MTTHQVGGLVVHIPQHAAERFLDMALTPDEIRACITHPESVTPAARKYPGRHLYNRGRITLAIEPQTDHSLVILTALWATEDLWRADYALPQAPGREARANPFRSNA